MCNMDLIVNKPKKLPSSRYKGVVPQINGRWGAQIYDGNKRVWLGTFSDEVEAARVYDVAVQRFRGMDAVTNFKPLSSFDSTEASELSFLAAHSKDEIVNMLRECTYHEEFKHSERKRRQGRIAAGRRRSFGSARELLFCKVATPSDVGKLNRLVVPKLYAEKYFPLKICAKGADSNAGMLLNFEDREGKMWRFRYSYWYSSENYVLTKGWGRFVREKGLNPGDMVSFWRSSDDGPEAMQFLIDYKLLKPVTETSSAVQTPVLDQNNKVVRLFGVDISTAHVD